jgi:hypothetical protein
MKAKSLLTLTLLLSLSLGCQKEALKDPLYASLAAIENIKVFTALMETTGKGLLDTKPTKTLFIPTDEAFAHLDIADKRDYDKALLIAFLATQMTDSPLPSGNFKSGKLNTSDGDYVRMYNGREFVQIEDALVEKTDLKIGNLTVHLVDRIFKPEKLTGHNHNAHAGGHAHGGTHSHDMKDNCGTTGPSTQNTKESLALRNATSTFLATLPTWNPSEAAPRNLPTGGYSLMGGRNNGLPYIHYFSKKNMEDGKFMDPNAPEGLMYGLTADGVVYPISAVFVTREASANQLHNLNCIYMFHEHDGLPGIMMHVFHDRYPSTNNGYDHEADPQLVRKMTVK